MEEAQVQEPAIEQAPAQEAVAEAPVQETQQAPVQEAPVQESPAPEQKAPFQIFDNPNDLWDDLQRDAAATQGQEAVEPTPQEEATYNNPVQDQAVQPEPTQERYRQEDVEGAVLNFLSERLGRQVGSFDELAQPRQLDERIEAIAKFVQDTGRRPEDWFAYQRLNPSEMDDATAIRVHMASEHPNLSGEELGLLIKSKYRVSSDASEDDKRLAQLQMKMDASKAKDAISTLRDGYAAPETQQQQKADEPLIDDVWVTEMSQNVDAMQGLEFDLGNEKSFTFGLDEGYKQQLKTKNSKLENYFDPYVREDGSWDYDLLSSHRTVVDNIDKIVQSAYRHGMSDGQRGVVNTAANVQAKAPNDVSGQQNTNPLGEQVRQILRGNKSTMTFKL
jgi:hypothetical protein